MYGKWFLNGFSAIDRFDLNLGQSKGPRLMSLIHGSALGICLELLMLSQRVSGRFSGNLKDLSSDLVGQE